MRVVVVFENEDRSIATVTIHPSWIGRLRGRRPRTTQIEWCRPPLGWLYKIDRATVEASLAKIVDGRRRWPPQPVVPSATLHKNDP